MPQAAAAAVDVSEFRRPIFESTSKRRLLLFMCEVFMWRGMARRSPLGAMQFFVMNYSFRLFLFARLVRSTMCTLCVHSIFFSLLIWCREICSNFRPRLCVNICETCAIL